MQLFSVLKSYPILRLTIPLVAGIFLSDTYLRSMHLLPVYVAAMAVLFVLLVWMVKSCAYRHRWLFGVTVSLFLLVLGSTVMQIQWGKVACRWSPERKMYQGVVLETPVEKEKTMACRVEVEDKQILLYVHKDSLARTLQSGSGILFYSEIRPPHNAGNPYEFDYASYLLRRQISGTSYVYAGYWHVLDKPRVLSLRQKALACRDRIVACYRGWGLEGEELAVLSALTVGYKEELSEELRVAYSVAGVSHVLALSGLHVGILWLLLSFVLRPLNRSVTLRVLKWGIVTLLLWSFAFVAGLMPSVVRAVIMCMLVELSTLKGRKVKTQNTLAVAAFFMLLYSPFYLFDVSFQLSFMAVLAISLCYKRMYQLWLVRNRFLRYVWGVATVSVAAQLGTAPLVMYYFSGFSLYFLLANLMVAPLIPMIVYLALLAFVCMPFAGLHHYVLLALESAVKCLNQSAWVISRLPSALIDSLYLSSWEVCLLYVLILLGLYYWKTKERRALLGFFAGINVVLAVLFYTRLPRKNSPSVVFYNVRDCAAVHFIEADNTSYLCSDRKDSTYMYMANVAETYWKREKMPVPHLLLSDFKDKSVWSHEGIVRWKGVNICMMTDGYWRNKSVENLLDIDYMYLCKGYKGKIAPLQKLFHIKKVVLDASLSDYKSKAYKEECESLGLDYIDMSEKGSFRILL